MIGRPSLYPLEDPPAYVSSRHLPDLDSPEDVSNASSREHSDLDSLEEVSISYEIPQQISNLESVEDVSMEAADAQDKRVDEDEPSART